MSKVSIRYRLLILLAPTITAFILLVTLFLYFYWSKQIMESFKQRLASVVITTSALIDVEEHKNLQNQIGESNVLKNPVYQKYDQTFKALQHELGLASLYTVILEPVKRGEKVLLNKPLSPANPVYDGKNTDYAYRQRYIIDSNQDSHSLTNNNPGDYDFAESIESEVYHQKTIALTPFYESRGGWGSIISAFAPLIDKEGQVIALVGADVSIETVESQLHRALIIIVISAFIALILITIAVFFVASRISKPVKHLKNSALNIAAGHYGENIQVEGPLEIVELANTLNTMSECLKETMVRLRESSLVRERLHGEYECSVLMQQFMVQEPIKAFMHPQISIKSIDILSTNIFGFIFHPKLHENGSLELTVKEASRKGFSALYQLVSCQNGTIDEENSYLKLTFDQQLKNVEWKSAGFHDPLHWSLHHERLSELSKHRSPIEVGDFLLIYNEGVAALLESEETLKQWIYRLFKHFSKDGLDSCITMLEKELQFILRRKHMDRDVHIICVEITHPAW